MAEPGVLDCDGRRAGVPAISCLEDNPHRLADLVGLYQEQWPHWYGPMGRGSAARDLSACLDTTFALPRCLFMETPNGDLIGTVSLRAVSPGSDLFPGAWVTALLVAPPYRRRGVGGLLVEGVRQKARDLGFEALHAANARDAGLFVRLCWQLIEQTSSRDQLLNLYRIAT